MKEDVEIGGHEIRAGQGVTTILASARKTGRVVVVHEASRLCGVGAEVSAIVAEHAYDTLKAPIVRVTGPDTPAPASFALEQAFTPRADAIVEAARRVAVCDVAYA